MNLAWPTSIPYNCRENVHFYFPEQFSAEITQPWCPFVTKKDFSQQLSMKFINSKHHSQYTIQIDIIDEGMHFL